MNSLNDIAAALRRSEHVLIAGHVMPDGDSLGSVLALGTALETIGKNVTMAGPDPVPAVYHFLPGVEHFRTGTPPEDKFDTFIVLDCSVPERLGSSYKELVTRDMVVINIDHHAGSTSFGSYQYIDPRAAAVGEIIFDLLNLMDIVITTEIAICLYTAIITDTGSFRYDNTTTETLKRAAELLKRGVPARQINIWLFEEKPLAALVLLGAVLNSLSLSPCGKVCWMTVTVNDLQNSGSEEEHTEGLVNYTRSIKGVQVGMLFRELSEGRFKVSFRSKGDVDVNQLAALFGGGGHSRAAGCVVQGDIEEIREEIVTAAIAAAGEDCN